MSDPLLRGRAKLLNAAQFLALGLIVIAALTALFLTVSAAFGYLPWLQVSARFGDFALPQAGMGLQIFVTVLLAALCFYLPANARILRLERSHRDFHVRMDDVARAYHESHAADRAGVFGLSAEFDSVRDRIRHLREHPDLGALEPEILELAAQMSHEARDLAKVYSTEKVTRARAFLTQRQQELDTFKDNLVMARQTCDELRRWSQEMRVEEQVVEAQMDRLEADLAELLPALGYEMQPPDPATQQTEDNVVPLGSKAGDG